MRVTSVLDKILEEASILHCHIGPFLALGIKAGLRAVELLGYDPFKMKARVVVPELATPYTCFADGIQFVTGCTLGKCNIELVKGSELKTIFTSGQRMLELTVRESVLKDLEGESSELEDKAREIMRASLLDIFEEHFQEKK